MSTNNNGTNINQNMTPQDGLVILKEGNFRFVNGLKKQRDLLGQMQATKDNQYPFAVILSCMDSRTPAELIFDQGLGDIFSIRIAGNIISHGILGSLEYATAVAGSKLIVVLGHTSCGAIKGACDDVKSGHITALMNKIKPSVEAETTHKENRNSSNAEFVNEVAKLNVQNSVDRILQESDIIKGLIDEGKVGIISAMYDLSTGIVSFYDTDQNNLAMRGERATVVATQ